MPPERDPGRATSKKTTLLEKPRPTKQKDDEELQLEKLVFGDDEGFNTALKTYDSDDFRGGDSSSDSEQDESEAEPGGDLDAVADDDLFFIDTGIPAPPSTALVTTTGQDSSEDENNAPAWIDSEDEKIVVSLASDTRLRKLRTVEADDLVNGKEYIKRLQQQFERLHPRPAWAIQAEGGGHRKKRRRLSAVGSSADESDEDGGMDLDGIGSQPLLKLLQSTDMLTEMTTSVAGKRILRAGVLDIQRSKDVGPVQPSAVSCLSFHPTKPILLSSGPSGLITLHHLSPTSHPPNPTIHTLSIPHHPIYTAAIHPSGETIYFSSRRRYFLTWSLSSGKVTRSTRFLGPTPNKTLETASTPTDQRSCERFRLSPCGTWIALIGTSKKVGVVNILSTSTSQWLCQARIDGHNGIADVAWWSSGSGLTIASKGGDVIEYSIPHRKALVRWRDESILLPTTITLGGRISNANDLGSDKYLAIGLQSGIVTIYDRSGWSSEKMPGVIQPIKTFSNLVTSISHLAFSSDAQLLLLASRWKKDALRLVHVASWSVYPRWPASGTPLGRVTAAAFSPDGKVLVVGNEAGKIRAWDIRG